MDEAIDPTLLKIDPHYLNIQDVEKERDEALKMYEIEERIGGTFEKRRYYARLHEYLKGIAIILRTLGVAQSKREYDSDIIEEILVLQLMIRRHKEGYAPSVPVPIVPSVPVPIVPSVPVPISSRQWTAQPFEMGPEEPDGERPNWDKGGRRRRKKRQTKRKMRKMRTDKRKNPTRRTKK